MIIPTTLLIGMTIFQILITLEWVVRQWRSLDELFGRPLYSFTRDPQPYMLPSQAIHRNATVELHRNDFPICH